MCAPWVTQHTSIRYSSSCHTRVNMVASIFFTAAMIHILFLPRMNGLVRRGVLCVLCTKYTLQSNHRLTRVTFQHTKRLLPRSGHFLTMYTCIAYWQKCELRWKTTFWEKKFLSCSFCLYRFRKYVSCGFRIINFYNPGVYCEMPCIRMHFYIWCSCDRAS
jgi:hypothetical protein